ncbi:uncharacterized protein YndB with AHSA1/START domain [Inquilinus ginsengisoli]|uniref:Uncharacterized protein YndB with AHSA1/START domain n=1 Tax=Inquilinus ginsengisoli TaxID=363840 RepID=A0ABU1JMX2_9PROT|nr:SRPBCC family protein [Inquilinus ginsengisoli]MDR6288900.1 uncharacterized protein YndB with AHSA1/START domain [Inquilinus ginsengisoli]
MIGDTLSPVRTSIIVEAPQVRAFDSFANRLGCWWPLEYTYGQAAFDTAAIEPRAGGRWYERDRHGRETGWGEVRAFEPPSRLVLAFAICPQRAPGPPEKASELEIRFTSEGSRTRVELEHRGFERHCEGAALLRDAMASSQGWPLILAAYARALRPLTVVGARPAGGGEPLGQAPSGDRTTGPVPAGADHDRHGRL